MAFEYLALATAYADARGLPYETLTKERIGQLGGVQPGLIPPDTFATNFDDFRGKPAGTWSDDTQHTLAMMESISECGSFSLADLAQRLRTAYNESHAGWGGASKQSISQIEPHLTLDQLRTLGNTTTQGCGPLMRLTPLAIHAALHPQKYDSDQAVVDMTTLTHNTPESVVSALVHSLVVREVVLATHENRSVPETLPLAYDAAIIYEAKYPEAQPVVSMSLLQAMSDQEKDTSCFYAASFAAWYIQALTCTVIDNNRGASFETTIEAVIAEGGDTDSSAALVAGLWVCSNPNSAVEVDDMRLLQQYERLVSAGIRYGAMYE